MMVEKSSGMFFITNLLEQFGSFLLSLTTLVALWLAQRLVDEKVSGSIFGRINLENYFFKLFSNWGFGVEYSDTHSTENYPVCSQFIGVVLFFNNKQI